MEFAYALLPDFPRPPKELTSVVPYSQTLIKEDGSSIHEVGTYYQMTQVRDGKLMKCSSPASIIDKKIDSWLKENIPIIQDWKDTRVNYYIPMEDTCDSIGVHTDKSKDYILLYNIDIGGPDACLTFWQERGQPLVREKGLIVEDPSLLDKKYEIIGPIDCWYLINSRVLHSVEKVIKPRINIQISMYDHQAIDLLKHLNCWYP
tara:strand:- start:1618 stop:2229 length:612 start_codon:yes stop_codon:yes gene_type:complete